MENTNSNSSISNNIRDISLKAFGVHQTLNGIKKLLEVTRFLALNAKISSDNRNVKGGTFTTMVSELGEIVREINGIFAELEGLSWEMASRVARALKARSQFQFYYRALAQTAGNDPRRLGRNWEDLLVEDGRWIAGAGSGRGGLAGAERAQGVESTLWNLLARNRKEMTANLQQIGALVAKLSRLVDNLHWIAIQRIHLIAVSALVETSRDDVATTNLPIIANKIRAMAREIAEYGGRANDQILDLNDDLGRMMRFVGATSRQSLPSRRAQ